MTNLLLKEPKAQASAVFEVLIGVIIMGFVLFFGYQALATMSKERCANEIASEMADFARAIERTVHQRYANEVDFWPPSCFKNAEIKLSTIQSKAVCSSICQEGKSECVVLDFFSPDYVHRECVDIPLKTAFSTTLGAIGSGGCEDKEDEKYFLVDLYSEPGGIPAGHYLLVNTTPPGNAFPVICAYVKRKRSI